MKICLCQPTSSMLNVSSELSKKSGGSDPKETWGLRGVMKQKKAMEEEWPSDVAADQTADNIYHVLFDGSGHQFTRCRCEVGRFILSALVPHGCISILF